MKGISQIWREGDGQLSAMRLFCFIALVNALALCWIGYILGKDVLAAVIVWAGFAFAGKVTQRIAEGSSDAAALGSQRKGFSQFFRESDGQLSSVRLFCFIALINALILTWVGFFQGRDNLAEVASWAGFAFAAKVTQRIAEGRSAPFSLSDNDGGK